MHVINRVTLSQQGCAASWQSLTAKCNGYGMQRRNREVLLLQLHLSSLLNDTMTTETSRLPEEIAL